MREGNYDGVTDHMTGAEARAAKAEADATDQARVAARDTGAVAAHDAEMPGPGGSADARKRAAGSNGGGGLAFGLAPCPFRCRGWGVRDQVRDGWDGPGRSGTARGARRARDDPVTTALHVWPLLLAAHRMAVRACGPDGGAGPVQGDDGPARVSQSRAVRERA